MAVDWSRPVVHWEMVARDPDAQAAFYRRMFHWKIGDGDLKVVAAGLGAPQQGLDGHIMGGPQPGFVLYVQVADIGASTALASELGEGHEQLRELSSVLTALRYLPPRTDRSADKVAERHREKEVIKLRLAAHVWDADAGKIAADGGWPGDGVHEAVRVPQPGGVKAIVGPVLQVRAPWRGSRFAVILARDLSKKSRRGPP